MAIEKHVGEKYNHSLTTTQVAARIRAEIKGLQKAGSLAKLPISVRTHNYSMGSAIYVSADAPPSCFNEDWETLGRLTAEGIELSDKLEAVVAAYRKSERDFHTDYSFANFYANVSIDRAQA